MFDYTKGQLDELIRGKRMWVTVDVEADNPAEVYITIKRGNEKMANETTTKLVTGTVRLSYANIWEPKENDQGQLKYSCSLLIPKSDKQTVNKVKQIVDTLKAEYAAKNNGKIPRGFKEPLHDGDEDKDDEVYAGHYFLNTYANQQPGIFLPAGKDANGKTVFHKIEDSTKVYSGCYCRASVNFYTYDNKSKGIGVGLNNIVFIKDGEPLGGRSSVTEDFANEDFGFDDDGDDY